MSKNRDMFELKIALLKVCSNTEQIVSLITSAVRSDHTRVKNHLDILVKNGLIEECSIKNRLHLKGNFKTFRTTQLGLSVIPKAEAVKELLYD